MDEEQRKANRSNHAILNRIKSGKVIGSLYFSTSTPGNITNNDNFSNNNSNLAKTEKKSHFIIIYTEENISVYQIELSLDSQTGEINLQNFTDNKLDLVYETKLYACLMNIEV